MSRVFIMAGCLLLAACLPLDARQLPDYLPAAVEEQLESSETAVEDDSRWQDLQAYTRHKIPLNTADAATLQSLGLLTPLQVRHLLDYRRLLGAFVSIYELQAVPGFDPALIRRLQPYVTVGNDLQPHYTLRDYSRRGEHALLLRYGRQLESARGYQPRDTLPPHYAGTPDRLLLRYRYHFPRYASWGVTMEKDAGEQFFKGAQQQGFDFYSAHLFIRNYKHIKALALGDFTVNMGQGLINWQSLAFGKSPLTGQIKREGEVLRPYSSAGEFYFFRGAGITLQQRRWQLTGFVSRRNLDGNTGDVDSLHAEAAISSLVSGGYHRSVAEAGKRGALQQLTAGGNVAYDDGNWHIGLNVIQHRFSAPLEKGSAPYDQFSPAGRQLFNASLDYAGTWKNLHCFGETAVDAGGQLAMVHGLVASVAPVADVALLYRHYSRAYQSMYSNAFGNNQHPVNESGCYAAVALTFTPQLKWEGYADLFRFPWLKYRSDAPSTTGRELLMTLTYTPGKQTEAFIRYRYKTGMENVSGTDSYIAPVVLVSKRSWRCQVSMSPGPRWKLRSRLELTDYHKDAVHEQGWLCYQELQYRLPAYPLRLSGRLTWFSTGGTGSSVYAMESNMLYSYSVMQLYGEGWQYNINLKWNINRRLAVWGRWSRVAYRNVTSIGSGWDEVAGRRKSSIQLQVQQLF